MELYDFTNDIGTSGGTSGGFLIKWQKDGYHIKTGRLSVRGYHGYTGIEPVIEVLVSRLAKKLKIDVINSEFSLARYQRYHKKFFSIVSRSKDFKSNKELLSLQELYNQEVVKNVDFEYIFNIFTKDDVNKERLFNLLALDFIICNEDRHNGNVSWLLNGSFQLSPIYDNGYSLLYDDIEGLLSDYKKAAGQAPVNSPIYKDNKSYMMFCLSEYKKKFEEDTFNINIRKTTIHDMIRGVREEYDSILKDYEPVDTIRLSDEWFESVEDFIWWRLDYVRNL